MMAVAQPKQSMLSAPGLLPSADLAAADRRTVPEFSKDEELAALRQMLLIRRFEEKAGQMYGMGLIGGFCHLYIGQ
jgi:pyruvate dehydrogenase E1 component alpha subunit